ncbi:InlB B-repeat-containing protein [[Clostridium] hylemonae]|uniref:InlB B-repeat-containing protein n=1 Tax=[Clostridium] hylemonae TaxID=89153 RepID=UPI001D069701|nr:InlB B-repeat-containing protein [[Clostridium] hylemonae]MCB7522579.1 InlB B-repeat-containing protein [[Clostridium] hylemonae]
MSTKNVDGYVLNTEKTNKGTTVQKDNTAPIKFYYDIREYKISYNLEGGEVKEKNPESYTIFSEDIKLNNPTKKGYVFTGWSGTDLGSITEKVTIPTGSTGDREYTANWEANKATVSVWFYKAEGDSNAYVVTADGKLSTNGALNIYSKEINTENKEGYSAEQIKEYADIAYSITEEADRYDAYEIQVLHKDTGEWETIDNLDTYNIQDGDDIRYHVTAEAAHKLTYVSGDHSHGEQFLDGYYYKGESAAVKSFNDTGLAADTGYKFDHWENAAGETVSGSYTMGDKDTELKAVCVKDDLSVHELKYTVEYYKDGVIVTGDTKEIKRNVWINDNEIPVLPNDIDTSDGKYPGYHFTGTDPKEIGETVKNGATVKVYYAANTDTAYTVQRFYETDGSYKAEPDEILPGEGTTGQLADTIEYRSTDRPGYVYDKDAPGTIESGVIQGDGSLVLKVYFKQQFSVTYKPGTHGTFDDKTFSGLGYNADTPAFTAEGEAGYEFAGWAPDYSDKVTSSVEYVAQWKAADNTKYTVEYYYQNEGTYPETTENRRDAYGTTGDTAKLTADDTQTARAGYVYDSEYEGNVTEGTINGDGSLVLKVYFKQQFSVVYKPGTQGTFPERVYDDLDYGVKTPAFGAQPTGNPGYTFAGWGEVAENVTDNAQYTAQWTANTNTAYTVEHYQEQLNGSYTETETENLTGTTGATATATRKTYTGFTFNPEVAGTIESGTITGDGKLVLKLFYSRDEHTVTYMVDGQQYGETDTYKYGQNTAPLREQPVKEGYTFNGWNGQLPEVMGTEDVVISGSFTINSYNVTYELDGQPYGETERYEFGSDVSVRPAPEVPAGYHFGGWSQKEDFKMPAKDVKIEGSIIANENTKYRVEHYKENLNGTFTLAEGRDETGTTGTPVTEAPKKYEGFTYDAEAGEDPLASGTIAGDGSLTLKLYYTRNSYDVTYKVDGAAYGETQSYKYGAQVSIEPDAVKEGYKFSGWSRKEAFEMPASDVEITGTFTANGDTKYTVKHYLEGLDGKYVEEESEEWTGETDTIATANEKFFTGFTYDKNSEKNVTEGTITGDGKLVLKLYYTRDEHTVTYMVDGQQYGEIDTYKYGQNTAPLREQPVKEGYTFNGWNGGLPEVMGTEDVVISGSFTINSYNVAYELDGQPYGETERYEYGSDVSVRPAPEVPAGYHFSGWSQKEDFKMPAKDVKIEGSIIANDDTKYRVEHYKENLNGTFTLAEGRDETGTTGTPVTEAPKKYEGFTYDAEAGEDPLASGTIAGDGSLTLKLYYTRNSYDVTYKVDGAAYGETQSYKYGEQVSIEPDAVKEGYKFSGWSQKDAFEMPANDVEITGTFTANGDTKYTIIHYLEGLDGKYVKGLTEPLNGKTDTIAIANPTTFTGFTYDETSEKNVTEGTITGDGKLVLKLYYTRDEHTVTYMVDGQQYGEIDTYKYDESVKDLRKEPTKEGYTFSGWDRTLPDKMGTEDIVVSGSFKVNSYNVTYELDGQPYGAEERYEYGSDVTVRPAPEVPAGYHFGGWSQKEDFKMPAKDVKIEGSIIANDDTKYRVEHYKENLNGTFTLAEGRDETGTTGTPVTEAPKKYEGYTYDAEAGEDPLASGTIAGDGSLTLKLYYTRNSYNVTYKVDGAAYAGPQSYKYGEQVSIEPDAVKEGYTFSGWSQKEAFEMPANDVEITGTFTANGDTKYTVIHYLEGLDGKYEEGLTEPLNGKTDTIATANPTTFTGFTYDETSEKNVTEGTITGDGKLVLKLYYTRDEHTVTYMVDGQQYGEIDTYKYDESVKDLRKEPTKEGHTFSGWDRTLPDKMGTEDIVVSGSFKVNSYNVTYELDGQPYGAEERYEYGSDVTVRPAPEVPAGYHFGGWSQKEDFKMPAKDVKIEGSIIANDDTKYRVEHYKENLNGTFTLAEGRDETGTTGTPVTEAPKKYEGYTYDAEAGEDPLASGTIAGDGSLTLKLYYTRNSYNVTYKVDGAAYAGPQSYKYGQQVSIEPDAVKEGYTFSGWSQKEAFEMPANDVEITGTFTANGDTKFIVKHYLEGLDGKYTEGKSEDKTGETDTIATANPTTFTGFTYDKNSEKNVTTGTITGDGKLVLKLYYTRDEHTVTYKVDGQQYGKSDTYKYGADIAGLRKEPTKEGYTFSGWDRTLPDKMGTEDIVVNGSFTINTYKVTYLVDDVQYGAVDSYVYNSDVTLRNAPDKEGYTFSGWQHPDNFKMPAKDVVIKGTFSVNNYKYTVNYYYDNNLADDETVSENAPFSSTVSAKTPGTKERDGQNYMLDDIGLPYETTISTNEDANVINVYYVLDNNGPEGKPDGIPDSEEYAVTYNANAQNATGETVDNSIYPVDYQVVLKANGFVNEGYVFDGWSSGTDDQNLYQPNGWIKMAKGGLVMNAQWSAAPVTPAGTNPGGTTPGGNDTAAPANAGTITPAAVIQTITEPVAAFVQNVGNAVGANVQQLVQSDDEGVPLANRASKDHKCCILHFLLLLLALLVEIGYTRSMKKRQERIFELREEIAMADKEIEKDEAA